MGSLDNFGAGGLEAAGSGGFGGVAVHGVGGPGMGEQAAGNIRLGGTRSHDRLADTGTAMARSFRKQSKALRACYEKELKKSSSLTSKLTLNLVVDQAGKVLTAAVSDSRASNPSLEKCLVAAGKRLRFPPTDEKGERTLAFPLIFTHE